MEQYLLATILVLLTGLIISFVIFIADYCIFKNRIEKILDLNIEVNNITKEVNDSVKQVCELNSKLSIRIYDLLEENNHLRINIDDKD